MKKVMGLVVLVVVAIAFTAWAAETEKVTVKKEGDTTSIKVKEKAPGEKTTAEVKKEGTTVQGKIETTSNKGAVEKDTVQFEKYEAAGDYIYVVKENKVMRLKHTLNDSMKKDMLGLKKGDTVVVTSTRPLSAGEVAVITGINKTESANKAIQADKPAGTTTTSTTTTNTKSVEKTTAPAKK